MVVALKGLERRYRGPAHRTLRGRVARGGGAPPGPYGWSAADHVVAATRGIAAASGALDAVLTVDAPRVPSQVMDPADRPEPEGTGSVDGLLTELGRVATAAADRIARVPANEWSRAATLDDGSGRTITALDVARMAVDTGVSHLRAPVTSWRPFGTGRPASPDTDGLGHIVSGLSARGRRAVMRSGGPA